VSTTEAGVARCSSCGAHIWWGRTVNHKRMPLDAQPVEDGNVVVDQDVNTLIALAEDQPAGAPVPAVRVLKKGEVPGDVPRYTSHFATCANADRHRRPKVRGTS
jgi:hypothetical protein